MGIKERVHKKLLKIDHKLAEIIDKNEFRLGFPDEEIDKMMNHYTFKIIEKAIDLTLKEVKGAIDEFEDILIEALGWNKPEHHLLRGQLGIKFSVLKNRLGLNRGEK